MLAAGLLVLAAVAAYSNSFECPFAFDDHLDIVNSISIRHLWPIRDVFIVPSDGRAALHGRPVVNLSLALDYAVAGIEPRAYHLTNLLVHLLAGLTLFGIVRRTLVLPSLGGRFAGVATPLALAVALIWTLHPLQTEAVTYVIQRYESMMGLFYLLALYAALRSGTSIHPGRWGATATAAALLSMGCKEVAVSIPITILLYDRAFLAGSFSEAWRRRRGMYVGLAAAWAAFALLFAFSFSRNRWAGYELPVSWMEYARSQFGVILHYLGLSFWPHPLVLDYGWPVARTTSDVVPGIVVIGGLAAATVYALIRWPKWGFLGAWFFLILAPTSSVMPLANLAFEHRMYLPLAAVAAAVVVGGWVAGQWLVRRGIIRLPALQATGGLLVMSACTAFGVLTFQRNVDYQSELSLWEDTVAEAPGNEGAHNGLGIALVNVGRIDDAIAQYQRALDIRPDYIDAHNNLGIALLREARIDEAIAQFQKSLAIKPDYAKARNNLGVALLREARIDEAIAQFQQALDIRPDYAEAHKNLGNALMKCGRFDEAIGHYQQAITIEPDYADAHNDLGNALVKRGQANEAIAHFRKALELRPDYAEAHHSFGVALAERGEIDEAIAQYRQALEIRSDYPDAENNLGNALMKCGRFEEAIGRYQQALRIKPDYAGAHNNLGIALAERGRLDEAIPHFYKALELRPDYAAARKNLGAALTARGRLDEAILQFETVLKTMPDDIAAHDNLGIAQSQREEIRKTLAERRELLQSRSGDVALLGEVGWMLATNPNASIRNGAEAIELAQRAAQISGARDPTILGTLAAAYAEAGRFPEAVQTARQAVELAIQQGKPSLAKSIKTKIPLYEAGIPCRETPPPSPPGSTQR